MQHTHKAFAFSLLLLVKFHGHILWVIRPYLLSLLLFTGVLLWMVTNTTTLYATELMKGKPALPRETCQTTSHPTWTPQERWIWERVCVGEIANLNEVEGHGGMLNPKTSEGWSESRVIRPAFLETILLYEPYRNALTHHGVRIIGAWFKEPLDLSGAILAHLLLLGYSRFEANVFLNSVQTSQPISLEGSTFTSALNMNMIQVESILIMRGAKYDNEVDLVGAKIRNELDLEGATFTGLLRLAEMQVDGNLSVVEGKFTEVILQSTKIGRDIVLERAKFTSKLNMNALQIGANLLVDRGEFGEVDLIGATVGGQINISGSIFTGTLHMSGLQVKGSFLILPLSVQHQHKKSRFITANLSGAKIEGQLAIAGATFTGSLNMNDIQVNGGLLISEGARFFEVDLRSAEIGVYLGITSALFN